MSTTTEIKPRGKCTGCAFSYQLGTARSGDHKGGLVIRKHNSRTGPGLCSGAGLPPESEAAEPVTGPVEEADVVGYVATEQVQAPPVPAGVVLSGASFPAAAAMDLSCGHSVPPGSLVRSDGTGGYRCDECGPDEATPNPTSHLAERRKDRALPETDVHSGRKEDCTETNCVPLPERKHCTPGGCRGCCGCSQVCTKNPCGDPAGYAVTHDKMAAGNGEGAVVPSAPAGPGHGVFGVDRRSGRTRVRTDQRGGSTGEGVPVGVPHLGGGDPGQSVDRSSLPEQAVRAAGSPGSGDLGGEHAAATGSGRAPQREEDALPAGAPVRRDEHGVRVSGDRASVPGLPTGSEPAVPPAAQGAGGVMQFADPAPVMTTEREPVSGQPEPDRDRYGRYLIHGQSHTRATTFAKLGSSTFALGEWNERMLIKGLVERPDLLAMAHGLDVKRDRARLNQLADDAQTHAGNKVSANIGTALHGFSERLDAGLMTLDEVPEQWRHRMAQYRAEIARYGLTTRREWIERTTAVRADQVSAPLPVAGTLDRIFQLPNGELVIGDLKSGADLSYGWAEIAVQLALYAHGVNTHGLFDWNTKTWHPAMGYEVGEFKVRTDWAVVMHLPAEGDGCTLYRVDLVKGWEYAQVSGRVQSRQKDKSIASPLTAMEVHAPTQVATTGPAAPHMNKAAEVVHAAQTAEDLNRVFEYAQVSGKFSADDLTALKILCAQRWQALNG